MPKKILIVEDNEKNRVLIRDVLKYYGYEVIEAVNGEEGVKAAKEEMPDLIRCRLWTALPRCRRLRAILLQKA